MSTRNIYLGLSIAGAIVPYYFFIRYFSAFGFSVPEFAAAVLANPAAIGFTADLLITSVVFWVAMLHRTQLGKGPKPLLFIVLNLAIGLSCALPAYLYANEKLRGT